MSRDDFGPWLPGLEDGERLARWRSLAALALVYLGAGHPLLRSCLAAEKDGGEASKAMADLDSVAPIPRRRLLATYAVLLAAIDNKSKKSHSIVASKGK